ncbi:hypothetical protein PR048_021945 [Dryococelus australis]|uniref:Uncharacterized protein n=1 Tax=Dryococelus australis TaxID=614101 RepID=A0ABQ9GZP6_9NEOP|nr:hypothetical protein PR048_021945 [Dryococelus australis]
MCIESPFKLVHHPKKTGVETGAQMYNSNNTIQNRVKYHCLRDIFLFNFNISFKSPSTDACSTCIQLKSHKNESLLTLRIPDQSAYYSRQLYLYNLTVLRGHSKAKQTNANVTIYVWLESEHSRGSHEICSTIWDTLNIINLEGISSILPCSDGCPSQHKNTILNGMVTKWLTVSAPNAINKVTVLYPFVGDSFLLPDRIFGRIKKVMRKRETVITPDEYLSNLREFGQEKILGPEVPVLDGKQPVQQIPNHQELDIFGFHRNYIAGQTLE